MVLGREDRPHLGGARATSVNGPGKGSPVTGVTAGSVTRTGPGCLDSRATAKGVGNVFGYDYPVLGVFWSALIIFIWIAWIILVFRIFVDIFRSHDLNGWAKGLWSAFVILLPFLGVFVYLIARGHTMAERDVAEAKANEDAVQSYIRNVAGGGAGGGGGGTADELAKLADLRDKGVISEDEFVQQKAKILG
jgi:hypothetical protein